LTARSSRWRSIGLPVAVNLLFVALYAGMIYWTTHDLSLSGAGAGSEAVTPEAAAMGVASPAPTAELTTTAALPEPTVIPVPKATEPPAAEASPAVAAPASIPPDRDATTPTPGPTAPSASAWEPTHRVANFGGPVNLRAGPTTTFPIVMALIAGTDVQYLDEDQVGNDGRWMHVRTKEGQDGWIRQVDLIPISP
jgi:hypothetical protein